MLAYIGTIRMICFKFSDVMNICVSIEKTKPKQFKWNFKDWISICKGLKLFFGYDSHVASSHDYFTYLNQFFKLWHNFLLAEHKCFSSLYNEKNFGRSFKIAIKGFNCLKMILKFYGAFKLVCLDDQKNLSFNRLLGYI